MRTCVTILCGIMLSRYADLCGHVTQTYITTLCGLVWPCQADLCDHVTQTCVTMSCGLVWPCNVDLCDHVMRSCTTMLHIIVLTCAATSHSPQNWAFTTHQHAIHKGSFLNTSICSPQSVAFKTRQGIANPVTLTCDPCDTHTPVTRICVTTSRGLAQLHHTTILHRFA